MIGVYVLSVLFAIAIFFCTKCCIEKCIPMCIGGLCGAILIPCVLVNVVDPDFNMIFGAIVAGCVWGCCVGAKVAKLILALGTSGYGSFFFVIGAFVLNTDLHDVPVSSLGALWKWLGDTLYLLEVMCVVVTICGTFFQYKSYDEKLLAKICCCGNF